MKKLFFKSEGNATLGQRFTTIGYVRGGLGPKSAKKIQVCERSLTIWIKFEIGRES